MLRQKLKSENKFNSRDINNIENTFEYATAPTFIDPSHFTPPDKFIDSLTIRMQKYYNELDQKKEEKVCMK